MSLAILARKQREKQNISRGQFNVNGMVKASGRHRAKICNGVLPTEDIVAVSVKNGRFSNHRNVLTRSCFNGREGYICQRVWDGKKSTICSGMSSGESITSSQHVENKRSNVTQCGNRVFNTLASNFTLSGVILQTEVVVGEAGGKYTFTFNGTTYDDSNTPFVLTNGTYTFKNIPAAHPLGFITNGASGFAVTAGTVDNTDGNGVDYYTGDVTVEVTGDFGTIGYACYYHGGMLVTNGIQYQKPTIITKDDATNETTVTINGVTATLPCMTGNLISGNGYIIKTIVNNRITVENPAGNVISFTNNDVAVTVTAGCNVSVDSNGNVVTSKYNESGNKKHPYKCKTTTITKQVLSKNIDDYSDYMDRIRQRAINGR